LFPPGDLANHYSLDAFHVMGSILTTRSFTIPDTITEGESEPEAVSTADEMKVDESPDISQDLESLEVNEIDDGEEAEEEVVVLPLADMLNARYGQENVRLLSFWAVEQRLRLLERLNRFASRIASR
jgi:SET domain-containing protein 6